MIDIPCVIFAGGESKRMKKDKALLPFKSRPSLTLYQYEKFSKDFKKVYISCKTKDKFNFKANFIEDIKEDIYSPLVAIYSVFLKLKSSFFAISVDTPFFEMKDFCKLYSHIDENYEIIAAKTSKIHPLCAIYKIEVFPKVEEALKKEEHKLQTLLKSSKTLYVDFKDENTFLNLNYPKDYEFAKRISDGQTHSFL